MELLNIFWVFLIIASITPLIRQKMLEASRIRMIRQIEDKHGSRVITMIHRQESMSILGFSMARYIDINDSEQVLRAIQLTDPDLPIDVILHTPGGLVLASEQIAKALCKHPGKVTVFIPHYAMSGGTMIALSADKIVMDPNAVLGPVDPQVGQYPAVSILKVIEDKDINEVDDSTLILADMSRKALRQVKETILNISRHHFDDEKSEKFAEDLSSGKWTHDYPISVEEAREMGLDIHTDIPAEIYQLMNLYPQAPSRRPSVDYIPLPYPERPSLPSRREKTD
jgi:ClpP class serine protease